MNRYRFLGFSAYLVAATLVVIPFFDALMSAWPWAPSSAQWRFGAIGLASNALLLPCAGLLIALAAGIALGQYRALHLFGLICAAGALITGLSLLLFAIDAMQTRVNVDPAAVLSYNVASFTAVGKLLIGMITLAAFARAALRSSNDRRNAHIPAPVRPPLAATDAAGR
ncbi:MAG TPA: hypothetical protein VGC44_03580 [Longimicrobiales bacterium]